MYTGRDVTKWEHTVICCMAKLKHKSEIKVGIK